MEHGEEGGQWQGRGQGGEQEPKELLPGHFGFESVLPRLQAGLMKCLRASTGVVRPWLWIHPPAPSLRAVPPQVRPGLLCVSVSSTAKWEQW